VTGVLAQFITESLFQPFDEVEEDNPFPALTEFPQRLPKVARLITKEKNVECVRHFHSLALPLGWTLQLELLPLGMVTN
jgi:hypothetical protein